MKNAAGILLVIYLFFLVPLLAGAFIDAAAGVKGEIYQAHMQMDLLLCLEYFGVLRYFFISWCTLEKT